MFEKLVVSTIQRRRRRTLKFFVCTSIIYLSVVAGGFALSIVLATPKLADTSSIIQLGPVFQPEPRGPKPHGQKTGQTERTTTDIRNPEPLDTIISNVGQHQPPAVLPLLPGTRDVGEGELAQGGDGRPGLPGLPSSGGGAGTGDVANDPPRPPDPPKPQPSAAEKARPLPISSVVLQGKAIERAVPIYPELPKRIRLQGAVSIEVIISPEGRVESVRVVSGHLMLVQAAVDAARRWRFEATYLNGVAVRVTGVITFVFKINE